ncbi:MAG TPA: DUF4173 domain-containing protein [Chloroflexia bacterium]|jgi:hypothetical protein
MMPRVNSPTHVLIAAFTLGWFADLLFYGKDLGISALIFVLLVLATLYLLSRQEDVRPARRNLWLMLPTLFFAGMVSLHANFFLSALNVLAVITLLGLVAYFYSAGRVERLGIFGYPIALILAGAHAIALAVPLVPASMDVEAVRKKSLPVLVPLARGLLLALPVLSIFTCLLASADMVFASYLTGIFRLDVLADLQEMALHVLIITWIAWLLAGGIVYALGRRQQAQASGDEPWEDALKSIPRMIGFVEATTLLVLVDLLFLSFGLIQFAYLFGGQNNITAEGFTYADYARRGFFELIAVSVLTLGLILGLHRLVPRNSRRQAAIFNGLSSVMVGLVLVLLASAFWRMLLYQEAYGFTHLRLYVHIFEIWLAITFLWLLVTLWVMPNRFAIGGFVAALGFLVTLNIANPDVLIAERNLDRYYTTGKLDVAYLTGLSEDAVPLLTQAADRMGGPEGELLRRNLDRRKEQMDASVGWREWPAFHLARMQAYDALTAREALLQKQTSGKGSP